MQAPETTAKRRLFSASDLSHGASDVSALHAQSVLYSGNDTSARSRGAGDCVHICGLGGDDGFRHGVKSCVRKEQGFSVAENVDGGNLAVFHNYLHTDGPLKTLPLTHIFPIGQDTQCILHCLNDCFAGISGTGDCIYISALFSIIALITAKPRQRERAFPCVQGL